MILYPIPAKDFVQFKTTENVSEVQLFDQLGRLISKNSIKNNVMNVQNLKIGVYYLIIKTEKNSYTKKLIKE